MSFVSLVRRFALFVVGRITRLFFHYPRIVQAWTRRLSGKQSFILEKISGEQSFENARFAIFLIWQPSGISWYVQNALDALAEAQVNVILVVNHALTEETRNALIRQSRHILVRDNTGFDIGGYKDATNFIRSNFSADRVLYVNDSVYFFREGLTDMFSRMAMSKADVCSVFENWEFTYHVQSFCFSVSRRLFESDIFQGFWKRYLPVNSRLWAIKHGEIGLSRAMVPMIDSFEVIYNPNALRQHLRKMTVPELFDLNKYLPIRIRLEDSRQRPYRATTEDYLINQISSYSQVHTAGFLYRRFLGNPLIKRDLVYRVQYSIYDIEFCLNAIGHEGHLQDILADMRRKGASNQLPFIKKIQVMEGIL